MRVPSYRLRSVAAIVFFGGLVCAALATTAFGASPPARDIYAASGFLGGSEQDRVRRIAVDAAGFAYVVGETESTEADGFPVKVGPDLTHNGDLDVWVAKIAPDGAIVYCGFIGGFLDDFGFDIAVGSDGSAYVGGQTESSERSFPVTLGPDLTFNSRIVGGRENSVRRSARSRGYDGFVAKISPDGTRLEYCGYIGGTKTTELRGIAVDGEGRAIVCGGTACSEADGFPVVVGPDLTYNGNAIGFPWDDAWVARVSATGNRLEYCGYIGGDGPDFALDVAVDGEGHAYVGGWTLSFETTFPVRVGPDLEGSGFDGFVAKVALDGSELEYCGFVGGNEPFEAETFIEGIDVDADGRAYVAGNTSETPARFPVSVGPMLSIPDDADPFDSEPFVARVAAGGTELEYCGYIGGPGRDGAEGVAAGPDGSAYVVGSTAADSAFPVKTGPRSARAGGPGDGFVSRVRPDGRGFVSSGFHGSSTSGVDVERGGDFWLIGVEIPEREASFPVVGGPETETQGRDAFVTRILGHDPCRAGAVGAGVPNLGSAAGESGGGGAGSGPTLRPEPVVTLNGSGGGAWSRELRLALDDPIRIEVGAPSRGPSPAPFALYAWLEEPSSGAEYLLPRSVGSLCLPALLHPGEGPRPVAVWNNLGKPGLLGEATKSSMPAPSIVLDLPRGARTEGTFTVQGILRDLGSAGEVAASATNAIVVHVGP